MLRAEVNGKHLHFDYDSMVAANEVFKDRETGSRWQQGTATAISGPLKGTQLAIYPFLRTNWSEWKKQHRNTLVLKPLPGYAQRMTGMNRLIDRAKLGEGAAPKAALSHDSRLRPRETVAGLEARGEALAFPLSALREVRVVNDKLGGTGVLIVHQPQSDTTTAFERTLKRRTLQFEAADAEATKVMDKETKSTWSAYGLCLAGPLKGSHLKPLILVPEFWFAWSEFHPQTKVFAPSSSSPQPAQSEDKKPAWETLMRAPLPEDAEPKVSVFSLPLVPAPSVPRAMGAGHTHTGPVFAYILQGEIQNQVEPDPPRTYKPGGFFYEAPMHLHRFMRNLSTTEPAKLIIFQAGNTGQPVPVIKLLLREPLRSTTRQELSLLRLTLPRGTHSDAPVHTGPDIVCVIAGKVEISGTAGQRKSHGAGDVFVEPTISTVLTFRNAGDGEAAELLLYQVSAP